MAEVPNNALENEVTRVFRLQQGSRQQLGETTAAERSEKLTRILDAIDNRTPELKDAVFADLRKPGDEVLLTEVYPVNAEIKHARRHLPKWCQPIPVPTPPVFLGSRSEIRYEPKGVVLIISPWNFPFQLTLSPLISAVAAGNAVILKPSELSPRTARFIRDLINELFDESEVAVFEGDHRVAQLLVQQPFDHIFFTGSSEVGRQVMAAAAHHLTSVTLELGGKCPVIVDPSADLPETVTKVLWGKAINAGQSCVAPDYLLIPEGSMDHFVGLARESINKRYGPPDGWTENPDYGRIVNQKHFQRIKGLVAGAVEAGARVEAGGFFREEDRLITPTVLSQVPPGSQIMQEEIFGPVLPVIPYRSREEAIGFVNARPRPLALYVFARDEAATEAFLSQIGAGDTLINDVLVHFGNPYLPFGGFNQSGIGKTHGFWGFKAFSHERAVMRQPKRTLARLLYPPYTRLVKMFVRFTLRFF
jgi:aldehyde dehydrogenase (NAD+)